MFRVNLSKSALQKISEDVRSQYERIGLLIGDLSGDGLWVTDVVPGGGETDVASCIFTTEKLAKVADDLLNGAIEGKIVGWYHSHPGYGVFMSKVDLETQSKLLQFSKNVIAMVIDPTTDEFGIWAYENGVGLVQLASEDIQIV